MKLSTRYHANSESAKSNIGTMGDLISQLRALEQRTVDTSARAKPMFDKRNQLLPRERVSLLLDPGAPWLELSTMAGYLCDTQDPAATVPGAGVICGIGYVSGTRCVISASDAGIDAGAIQEMGLDKMLRAQQIALDNKLPLIQLIESAGANLLKYRVEGFVQGGKIFYNLARLSAAGCPVIGVVHGSSTAGGAYMPGLSDYVVMVRDRAKAFLAGPPLLKAATGEIATDEELGGAQMHTHVSGLGEYLAEDDADALRITRNLMARLDFDRDLTGVRRAKFDSPHLEPMFPADDLLGLAPADFRQPLDMREVIARLVDCSEFLEFGADYGAATLCGHASLYGMPVGIITNNGPIDPAGANKATHFIQSCVQANIALIYLQNTTGYIVGKASEQAGMIKHGSKMIQAVSNATVPSITIHCGASFGAGNYGMCGRGFGPRFVFSWPNARTSVMGAEQAATTMRIVTEAGAKRKGQPVDEAKLAALEQQIIHTFERQASAFFTSGRMLDDGVIDPRSTRQIVGLCLDICLSAAQRRTTAMQFGVARP